MQSIIKVIAIGLFGSTGISLFSQALSEQQLIERTLSNYPALRVAELDIRQRQALERTAWNPQPGQLTFEQPTDVGLAFEYQQQLEFPGVYGRRSQWLKSQTRLAGQAAALTRNEVVRDARQAYLGAQVEQARMTLLARQDSLWQSIAATSRTLFDGGQINYADLLFATTAAGKTMNALTQARADAANALAALAVYLGERPAQIDTIRRLLWMETDTAAAFYFEPYFAEQQKTAASELALRKAERLPGLIVGYLRAPEPDTDYRYRVQAGITVPIFQGQYRGEREAAQIALESTQAQVEGQRRQAQWQRTQLQQTLSQAQISLDWYERSALPQAAELISTSRRLYEGGEYDYLQFLRNVSDAFALQNDYLETVERYNRTVIELGFLRGL